MSTLSQQLNNPQHVFILLYPSQKIFWKHSHNLLEEDNLTIRVPIKGTPIRLTLQATEKLLPEIQKECPQAVIVSEQLIRNNTKGLIPSITHSIPAHH